MAARLRVLCVPGIANTAWSAAGHLRLSGREVREGRDARAARVEAASYRAAVCVLDLTWPEREGLVRALLANAGHHPRVIVLTDADGGRHGAEFEELLTKPVALQLLVGIVTEERLGIA